MLGSPRNFICPLTEEACRFGGCVKDDRCVIEQHQALRQREAPARKAQTDEDMAVERKRRAFDAEFERSMREAGLGHLLR
jgi:hypothetical protein